MAVAVPDRAGPHKPSAFTPVRAAGSVRRTTTIDYTRPGGLQGDIEADGRGRDLLTGADHGVAAERNLKLRAALTRDRRLLEIDADPAEPRLQNLIGAMAASGFRQRVVDELPDHAAGSSLLYTLLDDMPVSSGISGIANQRAAPAVTTTLNSDRDAVHLAVTSKFEDSCAGWAGPATIMETYRQTGEIPTPFGPLAPSLDRTDDPLSWHEAIALPPQSTRRLRRLDLSPPSVGSDEWRFDAHFRDSYCHTDGVETVVHEYTVVGALDPSATSIVRAKAEGRVLPWLECPAAVPSVERIAGLKVATLRGVVRRDFVGTTTCTHLNDTMRALADLVPLVDLARSLDGLVR